MSIFMQEAGRPGLYSTEIGRSFSPLGGMATGDPMVDMLVSSSMSYLFGSRGFMPGQFFPSQNFYDQARAAQYQRQRNEAAAAGFAADAPEMVATMRGMAESMGLEFGPGMQRTARAIADAAPAFLPFAAAAAPQTVDALFGFRGSRGVAADLIFRRGQHEVDPVTGRIGLSTDSAAARATGLYDALYGSGAPGEGLGAMRGMGVGTAAAIAAEASRMGLGPAPIGALGEAGRERALGGAATPEALRGFDARKTADSVRELAGAVSAIRDLFGENGRPDAPMSTLFKALNDLTQGGLQFSNPQKLEADVRTAQALMRNGGMTLDAFAALTAKGGQAAAAMGLDQGFGANIAQGAAAAGIAYQTAGLGAFRGPGALSREAFTAKDLQLRASATASGQASALAAIVAFQEQVGGLRGRDLELYEAIKENRTTYADGTSIRLNPGEAIQKLAPYMGEGGAAELVRSREATASYVAKYGIGDTVRALQGDEMRSRTREAMAATLRAGGVRGEVGRAADAATRALFGLSGEDASDPTRVVDVVSRAMVDAGVPEDQARLLASRGYGAFGRMAKQGYNLDPTAALQVFNERTMSEAARRRSEAAQDGAMSQALSALGRPGPLARLAEIVKGPSRGLVDGIATFLGGVPIEEVGKTMYVAAEAATPGQRLSVVAGAVQSSLEEFEAARASGAPDAAAKAAEITSQVGVLVSGDAAAAARAAEAFRAGRGLDAAAMARLERGEAVAGVSDAEAGRVRGLLYVASGRGNLLGAAEAAGVRTKSQVARGDVDAAAKRAAAYAKSDLSKMTPEARARAGRDGAAALAEADRIAGLAVADESGQTLEALGGGRADGVATTVKLIRELNAEVRSIAAKEGREVSDLLGSADASGPAAAAREKAAQVAKLTEHLAKMQAAGGEVDPKKKAAEAARIKALREAEADPKKAAAAQIEAILKQTGTSVSADEKAALAEKVAKSADPAAVVAGLRRAADAEGRLREAEAGRADARAIDALARAAGPLAGLRQGGAASAAEAGRMLGEAVDGATRKAEAAGAREPLKATFTPGTRVKIDGDELTFSGGIQIEGDLGATVI